MGSTEYPVVDSLNSEVTNCKENEENPIVTFFQRRRPIPSVAEQPTRFIPILSPQLGFGAYGLGAYGPYGYAFGQNGIGCWPQPPMSSMNEFMLPGGLPTISWLCSCEFCVNSVQDFIAAIHNSNGVYAACIATSGPVYNELLTSGMHPSAATTSFNFASANGEFNGTGETAGNRGAGKSVGTDTATAEKNDTARKPTATMNGFSPDAMPFYPMPTMAPNGYLAHSFNGMQTVRPMFYNSNYWAPNMNAPYFGNATSYTYSSEMSTYEGDANDNNYAQVKTAAAGDSDTAEEEIDVVGDGSFDNNV